MQKIKNEIVIAKDGKSIEITQNAEMFVKVLNILQDNFPKAVLWFNERNPNFGDVSPVRVIEFGRSEKVEKFINAAAKENEL